MKRLLIFTLLLVLVLPLSLSANGGPVDGSAIKATGNIMLSECRNVFLEKEDLSIAVDGDFADVAVTYTLNNRGAAVPVTYGFPVSYLIDPDYGTAWSSEIVPSFSMKLGGKNLSFTEKDEQASGSSGESSIRHMNHWYLAQITVPKGSSKISVRYRVKNTLNDWATSKSFFTHYSPRTFLYDLSPAGNWGDGKAASFTMTLDLSKAAAEGSVFTKIPVGAKTKGNVYTYSYSGYDLKKAGTVALEYNVEKTKIREMIRKMRIPAQNITYIRASSSLEGGYEPKKAIDGKLVTPWAEGKADGGKGEWIEIGIKDFRVAAVVIANGVVATKALYYGNNRIKKVKVNLLRDSSETFDENNERERDLADEPYPDGVPADGSFFSVVFDSGDYPRPVTNIRITILDTYKGTKFNDTCISEIYILGTVNEEDSR